MHEASSLPPNGQVRTMSLTFGCSAKGNIKHTHAYSKYEKSLRSAPQYRQVAFPVAPKLGRSDGGSPGRRRSGQRGTLQQVPPWLVTLHNQVTHCCQATIVSSWLLGDPGICPGGHAGARSSGGAMTSTIPGRGHHNPAKVPLSPCSR